MRKICAAVILLLCAQTALGQQVSGYVYSTGTDEALAGVDVYYEDKEGVARGVSTDIKGFYELSVPEGGVTLTYSLLGYETETCPLVVGRNQSITQTMYLSPSTEVLDDVVVSVGRYEQKLSDITVSMDLIKAADINRQNPKNLSVMLNTLPGVDVNDKQPSIRGGSGWTYGVGSRSLILVDGMSVLTPGVGEINWNTIPMENVEQVEVIKGASSVLYGSSALNGLINVRTKRPGLAPSTRINTYLGIYGNPKDRGYIWWDRDFWREGKYKVKPLLRSSVFSGIRNPIYTGLDFSHARRIGNWDVSGGLNLFTDEGYRSGDYNQRIRVGGNVTYHDPKVRYLDYGLNVNFLSNNYGGFFIWRSPDQPYLQSPLANMGRQGNSFYVDPFLNYTNPDKNTTHRIKGRIYYKSDNIVSHPTDKSIFEIADNMGFNYNSIGEIAGIVQNPGQLLPTLLPPLLSGNINAIADAVIGLGNKFFPKATPADYVDLISWVMGRTPLPTNTEELVPWLLSSGSPKSNSTKADNTASYYLDYQYSKKFRTAQITAGATYDHVQARSNVAGEHSSDNLAAYFQYDDRFRDRLGLSLGMRLEYYRVDSHLREAETRIFGLNAPVKPIFRGGLNYKLGEYSYLRASVGQGYRYPSIVEKFIFKDIGGVGAYPNPNLKAESGYNAEIGLKQGYKLGPFKGYLDVAAFYSEYKDMIEFRFGLFDNKTYAYIDNLGTVIRMALDGQMPGIGAQFVNVDKARIYGVDLSVNGMCDIHPGLKLTYNLGYVYIQPEDLGYKKRNEAEAGYTDPLQLKSKSNTSRYLKYRQKHSVKGVIDLQWKRFNLGTNLMWKSKTLAVDYFMVDERPKAQPDAMDYVRSLIFGDLNGYWERHNKGFFTMDLRLGVQATRNIHFQLLINNLLNKEYSMRPMDVSAPRTFVVQANLSF